MGKTDSLWLMFYGTTIDDSMLELFHDRFVDRVTLTALSATGLEKKECREGAIRSLRQYTQ